MPIKALVVWSDGSVQVKMMEEKKVCEEIQNIIGGDIDTVTSKEAVVWFNEIGKFRNLEKNLTVSAVGEEANMDLTDIYGTAVITGRWDKTGMETSAPDWMQKLAIEVSELSLV